MDKIRLNHLLNQFSESHILVLGDFFLDEYLYIDPALDEASVETGLTAYQITHRKRSPGAGGTVVNNLRAWGVGVTALSLIGDDGEGYELKRLLTEQGVNTQHLLVDRHRFTPTYTKPMYKQADGSWREGNRLDTKNRLPLPTSLQNQIMAHLQALAPAVDGIIVADQVSEAECGVITALARKTLAELGRAGHLIAVDSRERAGLYEAVILKPNATEALAAVDSLLQAGASETDQLKQAGNILSQKTDCPVFVTLGKGGVLLCAGQKTRHIPGIPLEGPLDIVGAGDSMMAGLFSALVCGATPLEAAEIGNLVASITVEQIGTTGTASIAQIQQRNDENIVRNLSASRLVF